GPTAAALPPRPRGSGPRTVATLVRPLPGCDPPSAQWICAPHPAAILRRRCEPTDAARCDPSGPTSLPRRRSTGDRVLSILEVSSTQCALTSEKCQQLLNLVLLVGYLIPLQSFVTMNGVLRFFGVPSSRILPLMRRVRI